MILKGDFFKVIFRVTFSRCVFGMTVSDDPVERLFQDVFLGDLFKVTFG